MLFIIKVKKMNFITWLKKFKNEETPIGDLARDTIYDIKHNKVKLTSYKSIYDRMEQMDGSCRAFNSLDDAYDLFKSYRKNKK